MTFYLVAMVIFSGITFFLLLRHFLRKSARHPFLHGNQMSFLKETASTRIIPSPVFLESLKKREKQTEKKARSKLSERIRRSERPGLTIIDVDPVDRLRAEKTSRNP